MFLGHAEILFLKSGILNFSTPAGHPYNFPYIFKIYIVSPKSLIGVNADLPGLIGCLATSSFSTDNAAFQTFSFGFINVDSDYFMFAGASVSKVQVDFFSDVSLQ